MLEQFRQEDRQQPPEELIEIRPEDRQETRPPDYQAVRDRVLKTFTTGRGRIASTSPQYKSAAKALDRFIAEIEVVTQSQKLKEHIEEAVPEAEISPAVEPPKENSETSKKRGRPKKQSADNGGK
ncbi:hypothetical protein [Nostoc sp.]|uniref:hypothetical protein n=1 Tax=Nostoc sp. TaxID=1180 RepID=UPI002FFB0E04